MLERDRPNVPIPLFGTCSRIRRDAKTFERPQGRRPAAVLTGEADRDRNESVTVIRRDGTDVDTEVITGKHDHRVSANGSQSPTKLQVIYC